MGWDFPGQKRVFYLIDICAEMIKYGLKLNVAKLQHYVINHVTTRSHEGYAVKRGAKCDIYKASRMSVHLDAKLHCTTTFGEAKRSQCLVG